MEAERIGAILPRVTRALGQPEGKPRTEISDWESFWTGMLEEPLRPHAYVFKCAKGRLHIKVDSSVYLQQFHMMKPGLTRKVRQASGGRIQELIFSI